MWVSVTDRQVRQVPEGGTGPEPSRPPGTWLPRLGSETSPSFNKRTPRFWWGCKRKELRHLGKNGMFAHTQKRFIHRICHHYIIEIYVLRVLLYYRNICEYKPTYTYHILRVSLLGPVL